VSIIHLRRVRHLFLQTAKQAHAIKPGHIYVAKQHVVITRFHHFPRSLTVCSGFGLMALTREFLLDHEPKVFFIIYYK
jgi:hypothetical protein